MRKDTAEAMQLLPNICETDDVVLVQGAGNVSALSKTLRGVSVYAKTANPTGVVAGIAVWIKFDRPIDTIVIEGDLTPAEQVAMQVQIGDLDLPGILSLDLPGFEAQLQQMDWARRVDVRRRWPNKLVIYVYKSPVAQWDDHTFLSADGDILQLPDQYDQLPKLSAQLSSPRKHGDI